MIMWHIDKYIIPVAHIANEFLKSLWIGWNRISDRMENRVCEKNK